MMKKILMAFGLAVLVLAGLSAAQAGAEVYPPASLMITADDTSPAPGQNIELTACCFLVETEVTFTLFSTPVVLGTVPAGADNVARLTATIPTGIEPGVHRVEASGIGLDGKPATVVLSITISASDLVPVVESDSSLPQTGASRTGDLVRLGAAAVVIGAFLVYRGQRRAALAR